MKTHYKIPDMKNFTYAIIVAAIAFIAVGCSTGSDHAEQAFIRPPYLQPGDTVGIMVVSSHVTNSPGKSDTLINIVKSWGVNVKLGKNLFKKDYPPFSVSEKERADEFMEMILDDNIKAILFYRGGYGAIKTLEYLDFEQIRKHPKWVIGFSDVTTYHLMMQGIGMESMHAPMLSSYWLTKRPDSAALSVGDAIMGRTKGYHIKPHPFNRLGETHGKIMGGNMTLISIAEGTPYQMPVDDNSIIMIEEIGESMNAIDGMMQQLKKSGKLDRAKAVLVGNFSNIEDKEDPWNITPQELIKRYTDELDVPVVFGFPAGHGRPNLAMYMGRDVKLSVREDGVDITF